MKAKKWLPTLDNGDGVEDPEANTEQLCGLLRLDQKNSLVTSNTLQ